MKLLLCLSALVAAVTASSELEKVLKTGSDQFSAKLFQEVAKEEKDKSYVLSAFSVLSPLSELALASVGESHDEILSAIGFPNDNVTKEVFTEVINTKLRNVNGVELKQANKIYIRDGLSLNDEFAVTAKSVFDAEVKNINFEESSKAADEINGWVEDHTNKRIKKLVDPSSITGDTVSILVNAIYFKGQWKSLFKKEITRDSDFYVTKDKTITVPMMTQNADFKYDESAELDAKFLEMPYIGDETSLVVALPNKIDGINELIQKISDPAALNKALGNMNSQEVDVFLPKFKIETEINLQKVLNQINIKRLFTAGQAKLNNILKGTGDLYVSSAVQKAFIEVNEEGAEAAAGNAFVVDSYSYTPHSVFNADHPFVFLLKTKEIILFSGVFRS